MKIFVILSRVPYPLEKGDKLRAYNQLKQLSAKHAIFLCCLNFGKLHPEAKEKLAEISHRFTIIQLDYLLLPFYLLFSFFSRKPFQVGYFYQVAAHRMIRRLISDWKPDHIYCQLLRTADYAMDQDIPKTIDYQDCFSAGTARRAKRSSFLTSWFWKSENKRLAYYEFKVFNAFNNKTIISVQDQKAIPHKNNKEIVVVPNGVDLKSFIPLHCPRTTDLLFTGNMSYPPNVESVHYLVNEILPHIRKEFPKVRLTICGADPVKSVRDLESETIHVTGWVKNIVPVYHSTRIFIAPMQMGAGLQNKLLEAMACGIPCITSELAANALLSSTQGAFLIGKHPLDYAEKVIELLKSEERRQELAQKGRAFVMENYSWDQAMKPLEELLQN